MIHRITDLYYKFYNLICGIHPYRHPWHSQWLSVKDIYRDLHELLPTLEGRLLDIGCMKKPYALWMKNITEHVGIDVTPDATVDHVIQDGQHWPLENCSFQSALCTQVLQLVRDVPHMVDELYRVLDYDGVAVITTPFCYNDMSINSQGGTYKDYWRYSIYGVQELFLDRFEVIEVKRQGGIGSTLGVLLLNWIQLSMARSTVTNILFVLLFPIWLLFCSLVNIVGWLLDKIDYTDAFYHNVIIVMRKK